MAACEHPDFNANVVVNRLIDSGRFAADVRIVCARCGIPFVFRGLPAGLNLDGAAVSVDGTEARLAIAPAGLEDGPYSGPMGFTIKELH